MKAFCQAPPVCLGFSFNQKPHHVLFNGHFRPHHLYQNRHVASKTMACSMDKRKHDKLMASPDVEIKSWYNLLGMSEFDFIGQFPESVWDFCQGSSEILETLPLLPRLHLIYLCQQSIVLPVAPSALDIDDRFTKSIVFDKALYKYEIMDSKNNVDMIMKQSEIYHALERIKEDIELQKFEWRDDEDIHTNVVEALVSMVGQPAKKLATSRQCDRCLTILQMWGKDTIDQIITQIKQLQVALILLAIKNMDVVLSGTRKIEDSTLLENVLLPYVKVLETIAYELGGCLWLITSTQDAIRFLSNWWDPYVFVLGDATVKCSAIIFFARRINYYIPQRLLKLVEELVSWRKMQFSTPNDEVAKCGTTLQEIILEQQRGDNVCIALASCFDLRRASQDSDTENARSCLFSSAKIVLQMLDLSTKFVNGMSLNPGKVEISQSGGYCDVICFANFIRSKGLPLETSYVLVHLCMEKQCQPWELTIEELQRIGFRSDLSHYLQQGKLVFDNFTYRDDLKKLLAWCCKLQIGAQINGFHNLPL